MNNHSTSIESLSVLASIYEKEQAPEEAISKEAVSLIPSNEVQLQSMLEASGHRHSMPARDPMLCYACHSKTHERCSYCLLPVCDTHGGRVGLWFTRQLVMVCTVCQARLQEIAREWESL